MSQNGYRGLFEAYPDIPPRRLKQRLGRFTPVSEEMLLDLRKGNPIEIHFTSRQEREHASRSLRPLGKLSPA